MAMPVTSILGEIFRHNLWANLRLLEACAALSEEQLDLSAPGTYGRVRDTLVHLFGAESRYVARLRSEPPATNPEEPAGWPGLARLRESGQRSGEALIELATQTPPDLVLQGTRRGEPFKLSAAVVLIQSINHATEHRSHVVSILTQNGVSLPELDGWAYGRETGIG
jgi:uncharacterized damage-inducible protein DinB